MLPAPGLFSTTTCCPSLALKEGAIKRATMSVLPPGAKGTISVMVLSGHAANTLVEEIAKIKANTARITAGTKRPATPMHIALAQRILAKRKAK